MPLPPPPANLLAQIQSKKKTPTPSGECRNDAMMDALRKRQLAAGSGGKPGGGGDLAATVKKKAATATAKKIGEGKLFEYDNDSDSFLFDHASSRATQSRLVADSRGNDGVDVLVPLAPCVYRMTDHTYAKKEPILLSRCVNKLGVLRCLERECDNLNRLLHSRLGPAGGEAGGPAVPDLGGGGRKKSKRGGQRVGGGGVGGGSIEEDELGKARFMELLSNCGVYQKVSELLLSRCNAASDAVAKDSRTVRNVNDGKSDDANSNDGNPYRIPQIHVEGLSDFLLEIERLVPALETAREEILSSQSVSFHPGLGELFSPGAPLLTHPDGMGGSPLGCMVVQSWYDEEVNRATDKLKRKFILVVEFVVSVGEELVFVAASEVYPEFHDAGRNVPVKDLNHRRLHPVRGGDTGDDELIQRLQCRGEFYASVATTNHYLEYHPNAFFPIVGGWGNNATRPLSKGGRVMVDVRRGILEGHFPIRSTNDGMSDTVKEAIKLFDQSKRTGVAVPFRTVILPELDGGDIGGVGVEERDDSDRHHLWMTWPMLMGFSFTARCWGKLLLTLPKPEPSPSPSLAVSHGTSSPNSPRSRKPITRMGVSLAGLGGVGRCGNVNYICFQEQAFEQLVLAEDKKELIRAVARNAGGGGGGGFDSDDDDSDDDDIGLDVVANKGAASIFLLSGGPGTGKTLTAEAIAELLKKPLYVVTAGDLGIMASEVEKSLGGVLDLCSTWDALVLIDEADIFLEARSSTEIQRNALVCVMLRLLEYYSGCLFLSSNRDASSVDAAIASRITVMLSYPPLDADGRAKVWKNLVELIPPCPVDGDGNVLARVVKNPRKMSKYRLDFTADNYRSLAEGYLLNGRQIKNSIVLARALARERRVPLSLEVLGRAVTAVAGGCASLSTDGTSS